MGRFCYVSKILPGKTHLVQEMWKDLTPNEDPLLKASFWNHLGMAGFESWLQPSPEGDFMIHCLEGASLPQIFRGLREQIASGNPMALKLQNFYQTVLGKNYHSPETEPSIENLLDISLPSSSKTIKRGFFYPLLPHQAEEHRLFRNEAMGEKRGRHERMMRAFGVSQLSTWLQTTPERKYIVVYTERHADTPTTAPARLNQGQDSPEWLEIAAILMQHTGLKIDELSPDVEWLTQPKIVAALIE
jgi:hypothetical protein